jgi:hypothetical protein
LFRSVSSDSADTVSVMSGARRHKCETRIFPAVAREISLCQFQAQSRQKLAQPLPRARR